MTLRMRLTFVMTCLVEGVVVILGSWFLLKEFDQTVFRALSFVVFLGLVFLFTPLFVWCSNVLLLPIMTLGTRYAVRLARQRLAKVPSLKVIAITGSVGKTTTKYLVYDLLKDTYRTQMISGNINTLLGVGDWVRKSLQETTEILVLEMGAYRRGDIANLCHLLPPDVAVITTLKDQHLERFGSFHALVQTKLELFTEAQQDAFLLTSSSAFASLQEVVPEVMKKLRVNVTKETPDEDHDIPPSLLQPFIYPNVALVEAVALHFKIKESYIKDALEKFELPERRKNLITINGFQVIDDSYNLSPSSAQTSLEYALALAKESHKQLVVMTAGIPEQGKASQKVNEVYGKYLQQADGVVVLQSIFAKALRMGLGKKEHVVEARDLEEALGVICDAWRKEETLILFQSELTDAHYV